MVVVVVGCWLLVCWFVGLLVCWFVGVCWCLLVFVGVCCCLLLFVVVCCCLLLFVVSCLWCIFLKEHLLLERLTLAHFFVDFRL